MTTLAARLPRARNPRLFIIAIIFAFIAASFGVAMSRIWSASREVTVKPCQTCPSCSCKPLLGGPRCGCPR